MLFRIEAEREHLVRELPLVVWPDVGVKSSPIFPKVDQKVDKAVFTQEWVFSK